MFKSSDNLKSVTVSPWKCAPCVLLPHVGVQLCFPPLPEAVWCGCVSCFLCCLRDQLLCWLGVQALGWGVCQLCWMESWQLVGVAVCEALQTTGLVVRNEGHEKSCDERGSSPVPSVSSFVQLDSLSKLSQGKSNGHQHPNYQLSFPGTALWGSVPSVTLGCRIVSCILLWVF